jgi:hypothetical protein
LHRARLAARIRESPGRRKTMRLTTRTAVLFFWVVTLTTGSSALATDGDWASAVDAAQAVDSSIAPPAAVAGDIRAVGGGDILGAGSTGNFALSGSRTDGVARGKLTLIGSQGQVLHADVVCIEGVVLPDGTKLARLVGRLTEPAFAAQSLLFNVSDTALPGGEGDTFAGSLSPAAPEDIPCEPTPGIDTIPHGNISIVVD